MPIDIRLDVTDAIPAEVGKGAPQWIAAWLFLPPDAHPHPPESVLICLPGGSYDKRYYHLEVPGHPGYSMGEHLAALGHVVLAFDHIGIGDSSRPAGMEHVDKLLLARANHAAALHAFARIGDGTLHADLPPLKNFSKTGIGHSMGGMLAITQQSRHRTYDRIGVLGASAIGVVIEEGKDNLKDLAPITFDWIDEHYFRLRRQYLHHHFHWEDVPPAVIEADDAAAALCIGRVAQASVTPGNVAADAANIDVPIFLCLGERDSAATPYAEPGCYRNATDLSFMILPRSAHDHNFASTRHRLWNRLHGWIGLMRQAPVATARGR